MVAFRIFAVGFAGDFLFGLQVDHPEVGFLMPNGETTVIQMVTQQETPVGGDAWKHIAAARIINGVDLAVELHGGGIEADAANGVLQVFEIIGRESGIGGAEIERPPVRRPRRIGFEFIGGA